MIKTCCGNGNYLLNDLETGKELGPYNQKSLKVWNEPHSNNVNALSTDEVDDNNNDQTFGQDKADDSNSSIANENSGSGRDRISVEAVVHTENIEKSDSEYPPSAQCAFTSPISLHLLTCSMYHQVKSFFVTLTMNLKMKLRWLRKTFLLHSLKSVEEKLNGSKTVSMNISGDLIMFVIKLLNVLTCTLDNEKLISAYCIC